MKTISEILKEKGWFYKSLRRNEDICYTKRQDEKLVFESEAKEAFKDYLQQWFNFYEKPENSIGILAFLDREIKALNESQNTTEKK